MDLVGVDGVAELTVSARFHRLDAQAELESLFAGSLDELLLQLIR